MRMTLGDRLKHSWNAFMGRDAPSKFTYNATVSSSRPDRLRLHLGNERSIITAIYNRIATDAAAIDVEHVRVNQNGSYLETINSGLNNALTVSANIDQTGRALIQDAVMSMLDEGAVAIVPTDTTLNPLVSGSYDIDTLRVGKIIQWYPDAVQVRLYNEHTGQREDITLPKSMVAIPENPFYSVMNEPNSTLRRLNRKLVLLDAIDEQSGSGKLDLIVQLPYTIKSQARLDEAEKRRHQIEAQLTGSKYGIAYIDSTEHITQLNRPVENNLLTQIDYLTKLLYSQLGLTEEIMNGTANDAAMTNYYARTIEPILSAITEEMRRKFLTKTARSQGQSILFTRDPFKLIPVSQIADIGDKMTRNAILSSNEMRAIIGRKPSDDPDADALRNKNLNAADNGGVPPDEGYGTDYSMEPDDSGGY